MLKFLLPVLESGSNLKTNYAIAVHISMFCTYLTFVYF